MKSNWSRLLQECSYFSVMSQSIRTMFLGFSCSTTLGEIWDISGRGWGCTECMCVHSDSTCLCWPTQMPKGGLNTSRLQYSVTLSGNHTPNSVILSSKLFYYSYTCTTPSAVSVIYLPIQKTDFHSHNFTNKWHHCWWRDNHNFRRPDSSFTMAFGHNRCPCSMITMSRLTPDFRRIFVIKTSTAEAKRSFGVCFVTWFSWTEECSLKIFC